MRRRRTNLSLLERGCLLAAAVLLVAAVVNVWAAEHIGGRDRPLGSVALGVIVAVAASRAVRLYRAGLSASLPTSVARVHVRVRPARGFSVVTVGLALVLPIAVAATLLALFEWGWVLVAAVLLLGCAAQIVASEARDKRTYEWTSEFATGLVERLCMRADMRPPEVVVEYGPMATAWTAGGRIHVTNRLLKLLDDAELEAVLAHEVAHLARRDAAVMEICSAPSRVLLAFARSLIPWARKLAHYRMLRTTLTLTVLGVLCGPPAFVIGWLSRLSVLGMSRAREFAADAAAATLTGHPSALASALMKLDHQREWTPRADLRQVEPRAVLCIVGTARPRLGRLFSTHPPVAARLKRLEETESRIQAQHKSYTLHTC
jgi:heat shock protein HtpX